MFCEENRYSQYYIYGRGGGEWEWGGLGVGGWVWGGGVAIGVEDGSRGEEEEMRAAAEER